MNNDKNGAQKNGYWNKSKQLINRINFFFVYFRFQCNFCGDKHNKSATGIMIVHIYELPVVSAEIF